MIKTLIKVLEEVGLNEKEARVYLALLQLGEDSVGEIAKEANIKRPTAYLVLESLEKRGLIKQNTLHKKSVYTAEPPEKILSILQQDKEMVQAALPKLMKFYTNNEI